MTIAAQTGDVDATRLFLSHGDDVNERDTNYSTPIIHLAWNGHLAVAKVLVEVRLLSDSNRWMVMSYFANLLCLCRDCCSTKQM